MAAYRGFTDCASAHHLIGIIHAMRLVLPPGLDATMPGPDMYTSFPCRIAVRAAEWRQRVAGKG
jgi:hypothetical protein